MTSQFYFTDHSDSVTTLTMCVLTVILYYIQLELITKLLPVFYILIYILKHIF